MKFAAFDLEIAKEVPDGATDIRQYAPLGIACAAVWPSDAPDPLIWQGVPKLSKNGCQTLVHELKRLTASGYTIVSWNGCAFDFFVLAQESGLYDDCEELALNHIDLMAIVTFTKGYYLAFDKALKGAGLKGKTSQVKLNNGTIINDMGGKMAPSLWAEGERDAVIQYLRDDVSQLLALIENIKKTKAINWTSNKGVGQTVRVLKLLSIKECFAIPEPDVSWMTTPPSRLSFVDWMPHWKTKIPIEKAAKSKYEKERRTDSKGSRGCGCSSSVLLLIGLVFFLWLLAFIVQVNPSVNVLARGLLFSLPFGVL